MYNYKQKATKKGDSQDEAQGTPHTPIHTPAVTPARHVRSSFHSQGNLYLFVESTNRIGNQP